MTFCRELNACRVNPYHILQGTGRLGKICTLRQEANQLQSNYFCSSSSCCCCVQWGVETRTSHSQISSVPYTEESCDRCVTTYLLCSPATHVVTSGQVSLTLLNTTSYFNRRCKMIVCHCMYKCVPSKVPTWWAPVSIVAGDYAMDWTIRGSNPSTDRRLFLFSKTSIQVLGPT